MKIMCEIICVCVCVCVCLSHIFIFSDFRAFSSHHAAEVRVFKLIKVYHTSSFHVSRPSLIHVFKLILYIFSTAKTKLSRKKAFGL